ncbi:hypothetical protein HK104_001105 [Borealophlyctis nickersoniae]|nr:hypothetical protein HK104_001105 [Borealophlyctis nickersoniae]
MTPSVRIQDPSPLTPHPLSVELPKTVSLRPAQGGQLPKGFLSATVPELPYDAGADSEHAAAVVTVQGAGVYLYDLPSQQCLHSWSVTPGTLFTCPARFLPAPASATGLSPSKAVVVEKEGEEGAEVEGEADGEPTATAAPSLTGNVYLAVDCGPDVPVQQRGALVWSWEVKPRREAAEDVAVGRAKSSAKFSRPIFQLATHVEDPSVPESAYIAVIHSGGEISMISRDLKTRPAMWHHSPLLHASARSSVLWSTTVPLPPDDKGKRVLCIITVLHHTNPKGDGVDVRTVRVHHVWKGGHRVKLLSETALSIPKAEEVGRSQRELVPIPVSFAYQADVNRLAIAYANRQVRIYQLGGSDVEASEVLYISLLPAKIGFPPVNAESARGPRGISITALNSNYLAVVASRKTESDYEDALTVWDTNYGTLQYETGLNKSVATNQEVATASYSQFRMYHTSAAVSSVSGPILFISTSIPYSLAPIAFRCGINFAPYFCPPLSLASVLGKLRISGSSTATSAPAESSDIRVGGLGMGGVPVVPPPSTSNPQELEEWKKTVTEANSLDREYLSQLTNPKHTKNEQAFEALLVKWLSKQAEAQYRAVGKEWNPAPSDDRLALIKTLPRVELSQPALLQLTGRIFATPSTFWPKRAIRYLLRTNQLSSRALEGSLMRAVLEKEDVSILEGVLKGVTDLSEAEIVEAIVFVCACGEGKEGRVEALDAFVTSLAERGRADLDGQPAGGVSQGQAYFLTLAFQSPRSDHFMTRALRKLGVEEVGVLLEWVRGSILRNTWATPQEEGQKPSHPVKGDFWWLFSDTTTPRLTTHWTLTLDALTLLLDAHLPTIILTPSLHTLIAPLRFIIKRDARNMDLASKRLRGVVAGVCEGARVRREREEKERKAGKEKGKVSKKEKKERKEEIKEKARWKRMVENVEVMGGQEYLVEVYKF